MITATVHPACHYYKIVAEDAIYDPEIYGGQRTAVVTAMLEKSASMSRITPPGSIAVDLASAMFWCNATSPVHSAVLRKIETMINEANPDLTVTHDTGCVTTLDKSQFAAKAHDRKVGIPVLSDAQVAALAMGAHPFRVVQFHWHSTDWRPFLEKLGINWQKYWDEFQGDLDADPRGHEIWHHLAGRGCT